jgi:hypothetical protein
MLNARNSWELFCLMLTKTYLYSLQFELSAGHFIEKVIVL